MRYDLVIAGAGSGGIGAAITAGRAGMRTLLLEAHTRIGGTTAWAGVNTWEPGVCSSELPREIHDRLTQIPNAVGIYTMARHCSITVPGEPMFPGGESLIDPAMSYENTLQRHGMMQAPDPQQFKKENWHGVVFEPAAYETVIRDMLEETGHCEIRCGTRVVDVDHADGKIKALVLEDGQHIHASWFIDATGDICLARAAGCEVTTGHESFEVYQEPSAPQTAENQLNGMTLLYRITPTRPAEIEEIPEEIPKDCWWRENYPVACFNQYPCGDFNVNMLPTMDGHEALSKSRNVLMEECTRRGKAHWRHCQSIFEEFQRYRMKMIFPLPGIRESYRLAGRYVLTEHDVRAGRNKQTHRDIIALADHALDTHGHGGGCSELDAPYGIPLRCLQPKEMDNLLVACRGASFSALAASSCRLSRTMIALGEAAANAL